MQTPQLICRHLPALDLNSWDAVAAALHDAPACALGQTWLPALQPEFRPASVRTGWTDEHLVVFAELEDDDIFNPVTEFNVMAFGKGDVFEMFLRPANQTPYYEFHVSPVNQQLQLRFPKPESWRTPGGRWQVEERVLLSQVRIAEQRWQVQTLLPRRVVEEQGTCDRWLFSFSRYDYTRGQAKPITSSTSPHAAGNFHDQAEWGTLIFEA